MKLDEIEIIGVVFLCLSFCCWVLTPIVWFFGADRLMVVFVVEAGLLMIAGGGLIGLSDGPAKESQIVPPNQHPNLMPRLPDSVVNDPTHPANPYHGKEPILFDEHGNLK